MTHFLLWRSDSEEKRAVPNMCAYMETASQYVTASYFFADFRCSRSLSSEFISVPLVTHNVRHVRHCAHLSALMTHFVRHVGHLVLSR